jgi:hypothetical protein
MFYAESATKQKVLKFILTVVELFMVCRNFAVRAGWCIANYLLGWQKPEALSASWTTKLWTDPSSVSATHWSLEPAFAKQSIWELSAWPPSSSSLRADKIPGISLRSLISPSHISLLKWCVRECQNCVQSPFKSVKSRTWKDRQGP